MKLIEIENRAGKVRLTEVVTKTAIDRMIDEIGKLFGASAAASGVNFGEIMNFTENAVDTLEIEINSPGGSVFDGYTIFNEIKSLRERGVVVTATITGMAASMASVIAMAANIVRIVPHGRMMIHDASNFVGGNADQLRKAAELLDGISADIAAIYAGRTGKDADEIRAMMRRETWMTADEAKANGFVDTVIKDGKAKAEFDTEGKGMSIFAKLFPGNEDALKAEASILENDSLRAELTDAQAKIEELTGLSEANAAHLSDLVTAQAKANELEIKIGEFEAKVAEYDIKLAEATAAAEVTAEKVSIKAAELLAAQGHPAPVSLTGDNGEAGGKTMTRSEIANLKPAEIKAFIKSGGKIID